MRSFLTLAVPFILLSNAASAAVERQTRPRFDSSTFRGLGPQAINLWKLEQYQIQNNLQLQDPNPNQAAWKVGEEFPEQWFEQPLDHFASPENSNSHTWKQRYWVNKRYYKPGTDAPVIVLDGGETSGEDRLPFLDTGIVEILSKSTGGIGIVLEHRYYGESIPVANFTTDSLRWLNNAQSAADSANFMATLKIPGIDEDVTATNRPWIYYGGSYAGARAAHMKILYPDLVFGAIASSAVTHAAIQNWEYMEIIRKAAPPRCAHNIEKTIEHVDRILARENGGVFSRALKSLFGLGDLEHDEDFVSLLSVPLGSWQSKCWDPEVGSTRFDDFCHALEVPFGLPVEQSMLMLPYGHPHRLVPIEPGLTVDWVLIHYARWIRKNVVSSCPKEVGVEKCFGTYNDESYKLTTLDQTWRLWMFQVCTEWGYFTTTPPDQKQPRILSRLITLEYESKICQQAFDPGEHFVIPPMPNVTVVNELGDFAIAADRLAIIDGEVDPWRPDTPHSDDAEPREDTILRPFKLIPGGVHHYDEYGLRNILEEPPEIRRIHAEMIEFVREWLKDWKKA